MRCKARATLFMVVGVFALALAACGGGEAPAPTVAPAPTAPAVAAPAPAPTATAVAAPAAPTATPRPVAAAPTPTTAPPAPKATSAPKRGGIMRVSTLGIHSSWDNHRRIDPAVWEMSGDLMNTIIQMDPYAKEATILPDLAQSWTFRPDGKEITMKVVPNAKWHDGVPVTAEDLAFTLNRIAFGTPDLPASDLKSLLEAMESAEAVDQTTLKITLKRPSNSFFANMTHVRLTVYPKHLEPIAENYTLAKKPISSGPFRFKRLDPGVSVELERNPDYWKPGLPLLDGVIYFLMTDSPTRYAAFRVGQLDINSPLDSAFLTTIFPQIEKQIPNVQFRWSGTASGAYFILKNTPPFNDQRVRQAIQIGIDRKKFVDVALTGNGEPLGMAMPPPEVGGKWGIPASEQYKLPGIRTGAAERAQDVETARQLLKAAGFGTDNPVKLQLDTQVILPYAEEAAVVAQLLKPVGFDFTLRSWPVAEFQSKVQVKGGVFTILYGPYAVVLDDPFYTHGLFEFSQGSRFYSDFVDAEIDRLYLEQEVTQDAARRLQLNHELQRKAWDLAAVIRIGFRRTLGIWQGWVKNYSGGVAYNNAYRHEAVWLDR